MSIFKLASRVEFFCKKSEPCALKLEKGHTLYFAVSELYPHVLEVQSPDLAPEHYVFEVKGSGDHMTIKVVQ